MSIAGRSLELALVRGARHYRAAGRMVILIRQHHEAERTSAPVDLIGAVDSQPWALEAKMTAGNAFPLKAERAGQRAALQLMHDNGFTVGLVIEFTDHGETFLCPWSAVAAFEAAPWRRSLSLDWCRAYGLLLQRHLASDGSRGDAVLFLDGAPHLFSATSLDQVLAERASHPVITPELELARADARDAKPSKKQIELRERMAVRPSPVTDPEGYRAHIQRLAGEGTERQLTIGARKAKLAKGRGR